jgi:t-SNARE complex subunit (syntaxin)
VIIDDMLDDLQEEVKKQAEVIQYMRTVVKAYTDTYQAIGDQLKALDEDEEPSQEMEDNIEMCFNQIQPLLTLWEDTLPENIDETLAGHSASAINKIGNTSLN